MFHLQGIGSSVENDNELLAIDMAVWRSALGNSLILRRPQIHKSKCQPNPPRQLSTSRVGRTLSVSMEVEHMGLLKARRLCKESLRCHLNPQPS